MIYPFFHIYCAGEWLEPTREFIKMFKDSDLDKNSDTLRVGLVGAEHRQTEAIQFLINNHINFEIVARSQSGWEQVTQKELYKLSLEKNGFVFYGHTKGAANVNDTNHKWRRSMIYYNVGKWRLAVEKLNSGIDVVGQHWMYPSHHSPEHRGSPFFGGTFWWATTDHIRKCGEPPTFNRHDAEGWIGYSYYVIEPQMKHYDFTGHISGHPCHSLWTFETQDWVK